jgi:hypothetical protein
MRSAGGWSGKLGNLVWLIERWGQVEADFQQFYGLDPVSLSGRRLVVLARQLPDTARIWGQDGWGVDRELAAVSVEMGDLIRRALLGLGGVKKSKLGKQIRIPRPYDPPKKTSWVDWAKSLVRR